MNTESDLIPGDLITVEEEGYTSFIMIVTEVKSWGVKCYAPIINGTIPYRVEHGKFKRVGHVETWEE